MRRNVLLAALLLFAVAAARAQVAAIYITSSNAHLSNVPSGSVVPVGEAPVTQYDTFWASGIGGGVTINIIPLPVVSLGLDFRGSTKPGTTGVDTALVGLKLTVHPPVIRIKPYIQGSAGYLATRTPAIGSGVTVTNKYLVYEVMGGVDIPLVHFVDLRLVEVGGGRVVNSSSGNNPSLFTINSGLVFHF
jgi:hypothetical protein